MLKPCNDGWYADGHPPSTQSVRIECSGDLATYKLIWVDVRDQFRVDRRGWSDWSTACFWSRKNSLGGNVIDQAWGLLGERAYDSNMYTWELDMMDMYLKCRSKGGVDATSWELMLTSHSKYTRLSEPKGNTPESNTRPELLPRLSAVPGRSYGPHGAD